MRLMSNGATRRAGDSSDGVCAANSSSLRAARSVDVGVVSARGDRACRGDVCVTMSEGRSVGEIGVGAVTATVGMEGLAVAAEG